MKKTLLEPMRELNSNIETIKRNENINWENIIFLPILQYLEANNFLTTKLEEQLNKVTNIKKLKFYKFIDFIRVSDNIENYLSELTDEIHDFFPENVDIQSIDYLLYEILINVYKHSKFENAYIQTINQDNNIDICIIDDGIGISGSFNEALIEYENDCEAIYEAINGKTTDKEKFKLHGRGLNSSVRITTLGFEGEMLIASGEGICIITKNGAKTYLNENRINGTFIIMRINTKKIENIYKYLKYGKINRITEAKHD